MEGMDFIVTIGKPGQSTFVIVNDHVRSLIDMCGLLSAFMHTIYLAKHAQAVRAS